VKKKLMNQKRKNLKKKVDRQRKLEMKGDYNR
jgi:hypothetical protein